tara:strand:- start:3710 stop:4549 length:840 start_codon:yes stop_codon:yes gene_type:complete
MIFNVLGGMASRAMQKRDEQDALANRLKLESEIMAIKEGYQQRALAREQASRDRKAKRDLIKKLALVQGMTPDLAETLVTRYGSETLSAYAEQAPAYARMGFNFLNEEGTDINRDTIGMMSEPSLADKKSVMQSIATSNMATDRQKAQAQEKLIYFENIENLGKEQGITPQEIGTIHARLNERFKTLAKSSNLELGTDMEIDANGDVTFTNTPKAQQLLMNTIRPALLDLYGQFSMKFQVPSLKNGMIKQFGFSILQPNMVDPSGFGQMTVTNTNQTVM